MAKLKRNKTSIKKTKKKQSKLKVLNLKKQ
jgi:hypothetical protein